MQPRTIETFMKMRFSEDGASLVEYALILALVSLVAISALRNLGTRAGNSLTNASNQLS